MDDIEQICAAIKLGLRAKGLTYADAAGLLGMSEANVKRLLSRGSFTLLQVSEFARVLGMTLSELVQSAAAATPAIKVLTDKQERQLVADETLLLVAVCALNHWTVEEIVGVYQIGRPLCLKLLLALERMGLAALLPGDRIALRVARDFDWLPNGPIRQFFLAQGLNDFLASRFAGEDEALEFTHAMLTDSALAQLKVEMRRLRARMDSLHGETINVPLKQKRGVAMLLALREWEPEVFSARRRVVAR